MTQAQTPYLIKADWLETCNCDPGCNCNFGGFPDHGSCEALIGIQINEGNFGDVNLSGVKAVLAIKWPKAIHEGNGTAAIFIDESASEQQVQGLATILTGQVGGMPWEILATTLTTLDGPVLKAIKMDVNGTKSGFSIDGILEARMVPLKNPVTGETEELKLLKGTGFTSTDTDLCSTAVYRFTGGFSHEHSGKYGEFANFEYQGH